MCPQVCIHRYALVEVREHLQRVFYYVGLRIYIRSWGLAAGSFICQVIFLALETRKFWIQHPWYDHAMGLWFKSLSLLHLLCEIFVSQLSSQKLSCYYVNLKAQPWQIRYLWELTSSNCNEYLPCSATKSIEMQHTSSRNLWLTDKVR